MLSDFSSLKKIELNDRHTIAEFTKQFPPYNDFEFLSLWAYNIDESNAVFTLNDNLVIKIQDFVSGEFFYSFLGTNKPKETIEYLLAKSKEEQLGNQLRLVPEIAIKSSEELHFHFQIDEDPDSFDYILSVDSIAKLEGSKYHDKRNLVHNFIKLYDKHIITQLDFSQEKTQKDVLDLFRKWEEQKGKTAKETKIELTAITRMLDFASIHNILGLGIYHDNRLIGFVSYHIVHDEYAILSFEKGDTEYKGIYEYLKHHAAKHLKSLNIKYINYEQDLGIPGLKRAKELWKPEFFLKKFTISEKLKKK